MTPSNRILNLYPRTVLLHKFLNELAHITRSRYLHESGKALSFRLNLNKIKRYSSLVTDEVRLRQVLLSLIDNAFKFTDQGMIELYGYQGKKNTILKVKDTGIGIPRDKQTSIFDRYPQINESGKAHLHGPGPGLFMSMKLVTSMGGNIHVSSEPGNGSTFKVTLPNNHWKNVLITTSRRHGVIVSTVPTEIPQN